MITCSREKKLILNQDYGIPKLVATQTRSRPFYKKHRSTALIIFCLFLFIYLTRPGKSDQVDWGLFAYVQYATDPHSMCNAFMVFEALKRLGSKADRVLLYPAEWSADREDSDDRNSQLLMRAQRSYGVKLKPTQLLGPDGPVDPGTLSTSSGFDTSITKLRAFELDNYIRVMHFDSDVLVQQHLDELFLLPSTPVAMPRAYWSDKPRDQWPLSSLLMLVIPDPAETKNMFETLQSWRLEPDREVSQHYDNDLLNDRFGSSAMVLPHRPYILQTNEFRQHDHSAWLGSFNGPPSLPEWDPFKAAKEAKLVHFDDWPLPKPWIMWPIDGLAEMQPDCGGSHTGTCADREVWKGLYDDFRRRRKDLCRILSVPAPQSWDEYKNKSGAS